MISIRIAPTPPTHFYIVVGFSMINVPCIQTVWHTDTAPMIVMLLSFIRTIKRYMHDL